MAEPLLVYSLSRETSQGHWCLSLLPQPWCPLHGSRVTGLRHSADCGTRKRQPGPCNNVFSAPERRLKLPLLSSHRCALLEYVHSNSAFSMNNRLPLGRPPLTSITNNFSETTLANQNRVPSWVVICRVIEK